MYLCVNSLYRVLNSSVILLCLILSCFSSFISFHFLLLKAPAVQLIHLLKLFFRSNTCFPYKGRNGKAGAYNSCSYNCQSPRSLYFTDEILKTLISFVECGTSIMDQYRFSRFLFLITTAFFICYLLCYYYALLIIIPLYNDKSKY